MSQNKIVITSAVPLNNGDAALVFSLNRSLKEFGFKTHISTYNYVDVCQIYGSNHFTREITDYKIYKKFQILKKPATRYFFQYNTVYKNANVFIAAPGGYLNSFYGFDHTLELLRQAKLHGKKTGVYAQSVGPLSSRSINQLLYYQAYIDYLYVRDQKSYQLLHDIGYDASKFSLVEDAAFLVTPKIASHQSEPTLAAISVRKWNHENRSFEEYIKLIHHFVGKLVNAGITVEFLSTCQGLKQYTNDSETAEIIFERLPEKLKKHCSVNYNYYSFDSFVNQFARFDLVVGTRLHMCILSLINQIPAFNISYEFKGKECYNYLEVPELSCDYNEDVNIAGEQFDNFLRNLSFYKIKTFYKIQNLHINARNNLKIFLEKLEI